MVEHPSGGLSLPSSPLYADVIVPRHLAGSFTYLIPAPLRPILKIGHCVLVPFGRSQVQGAVISLAQSLSPGLDAGRLKPIASIVADNASSEIPLHSLDLAKRVADYYVAPLGQCLRLVMPPSGLSRTQSQRLILTDLGRAMLAQGLESEEVLALLRRLARRPAGIRRATLLNRNPPRHAALIDGLFERGWIAEGLRPRSGVSDLPHYSVVARDNGPGAAASKTSAPGLVTPEWEDRVTTAMKNRRAARLTVQAPLLSRFALLLYATRRVLADGRTTLVLVGETDRARWLARELSRSGITVSAYIHQDLSDDARMLIWLQARRPDPQVVVGTRSAVFLPFASLGMIWIERAEDQALKEPQEPRYHAGEVAWLRAQEEGAVLILSSAHPLLEMDFHPTTPPERLSLELPTSLRPAVEVVDLRSLSKKTVLSPLLIEGIREATDRKDRVLLFLNRKGYATALVCQDCGQVPRCESCRVAFVYHRHLGCLSCSYCGAAITLPHTCSYCAGHRLRLIGEGTERVDEEVRRIFPQARVLRVDGETMRKPSQAAVLWKCIEDKEWDILVGTQAVLHDYAVPPVALVGAVQADTSLSLPDFRSAERTYHLLCDAAALARPASEGGRVIIQSYLPSHHAIQAVVQHDRSLFTLEELSHRIALRYPPAVHLIALQVSGVKEGCVQEAAELWVRRLHEMLAVPTEVGAAGCHVSSNGRSDEYAVLGPIPPAVPKLRGRHRRLILIKSGTRDRGVRTVRDSIGDLELAYRAHAVKFDVDVDPVEMW